MIIFVVELSFFVTTIVGFGLLIYAYLDARRTLKAITIAREQGYKRIKPEHIMLAKIHVFNQGMRLLAQILIMMIAAILLFTVYPREDFVVAITIGLASGVMVILASSSIYDHIARKNLLEYLSESSGAE